MNISRTRRTRIALAAAALCTVLAVPLGAAAPVGAAPDHGHGPDRSLDFRGEATLPAGMQFEGTTVGGLSSLAYDARRDVYYAISDDQANVRYYTLTVDVADGELSPGDVTVVDVTFLRGPDGQPFATGSLDPEGLTLTRRGTLVVTSEGFAEPGGRVVMPFVREFSLAGAQLRDLAVPSAFAPVPGVHGVRNNLGFESAAVTPDGNVLFVGAENALVQDGPAATLTNGSRSRILQYDERRGTVAKQFTYDNGPVAEAPNPAGQFTVNGLVELLPFDRRHLLAMERSFSVGAGNTVRLYDVDLSRATDVGEVDDLDQVRRLRPAGKRLAYDFDETGLTLDNLEGMTLGPRLGGHGPHGKGGPGHGQALVVVSDNNFTPGQVSQFILLAHR